MATRMLRRGLPRVPGGEPWPPADAVAEVAAAEIEAMDAAPVTDAAPEAGVAPAVAAAPAGAAPTDAAATESAPATASVAPSSVAEATPASPDADAPTVASVSSVPSALRRGLPRTPGGEPWPPAAAARAAQPADASVPAPAAPAAPVVSAPFAPAGTAPVAQTAASTPSEATDSATGATSPAASTAVDAASETVSAVRRGLPRTAGGEPWPPAGTVPAVAAPATTDADVVPVAETVAPEAAKATDSATGTEVAPVIEAGSAPAPAAGSAVAPATDLSAPLPWRQTVWNGRAPRRVAAAPAPARLRPTWPQAVAGLFGAAALGVLAGAAVAFVRALLSLPFMQEFLAAFPGEYEPAVHVEPGFAPWVGWQHFFNMFLMVLIIRSGLRIRGEKRPTAFWTPRNNPKGKVSLTIWFHQALDLLWLVNGVVFIVLLFATGHWARIVPTSWEVLPNALSAALQYVSFDWPTEHGWVNYNSLQQLAYFATVFLAAPLAAVTGFRMSGLWPKKAERLSKAYPVEWARAVHFPVMLYFVLFIAAHVALVFLTGFLRNLNHMFASSDAVTWTGFWVFVAAVVVIAGGWAAARPLVIAPIAKLFGSVSGR